MRTQYHFHRDDAGVRHAWEVTRLVELTRDLPVTQRPVNSFGEVDTVYWFDKHNPATVRRVLDHHRIINEVDTQYPVITAADGRVMDGMHRICRAIVDGRTELDVVQFAEDPPPTYSDARPDALPYLRLAVPDDASAITEIERRCLAQFAEAGRPDIAALEPDSLGAISSLIEAGEVTVAYRYLEPDAGPPVETVVGWIYVSKTGDERYLGQVSVRPDQQGAKVGSLLIRSAVLDARVEGSATMILNTERDIAWNRPLYSHLGWEVVPEPEWTDQMRQQMDQQIAEGINWSTRVHMRIRP